MATKPVSKALSSLPYEQFKADVKFKKQTQSRVKKSNLTIQKARYSLSLQEQKILCFLISEIKDSDTAFTEKTFDIKLFFDLLEINHKDYDEVKKALKKLRDTSWWLPYDDKGTESAMSFLSVARTNKGSGKATIQFHQDMFPHLLQLKTKYTEYNFFYLITMKSQYTIRLYELMKSVEGKTLWNFALDELKRMFMCENYERFQDFRRFVIESAVAEINERTDINVTYTLFKSGHKYDRIEFEVHAKDINDKLAIDHAIKDELDGQTEMN